MATLKGGATKVGEKVGTTVGAKVESLGEYIKEQRLYAQFSLRQLADAAGVSNPYLSQIERGLKKPSAEILQQIAKALRLSAESLYVRAGILEDRGEQVAVPAAIYADPVLTERQKRALVDIYSSFRAESLAAAAAALPEPGGPPAAARSPRATRPATVGARSRTRTTRRTTTTTREKGSA